MNDRRLFAAALALCLALAPADAGASYEGYWAKRDAAYAALRAAAGPTAAVIIGDSNVEVLNVASLGSCRFVSAGYGWARARDVAGRIDRIVAGTTPRYAIVMLGTNDAWLLEGETQVPRQRLDDFAASYQFIVDRLLAHRSAVVVATIPPIEPGKALGWRRSQRAVDQINALLERKARAAGLPIVDMSVLADDDGGWTVDGLHFTEPAKAKVKALLSTAVLAEIARTGLGC